MATVGRQWERTARDEAGEDYAEAYARRFAAIAAGGGDVHGEARFVEQFMPPPARVLDAGCGTGRVAGRLAERGYDVVGCDADERMLAVARRELPMLQWICCDLTDGDVLVRAGRFDLVLLAGNVIPLLEPGTLGAAAHSLARLVGPGGAVVAGFGLDAAHLPAGCPPVPLDDVDAAMRGAGLQAAHRWGGWDREPCNDAYVVAAFRPGDGD